ncbi:MAG: delta-60 repeat domain-containing protein, partial [Planctomycetota bacterium]
MAPRTPLAASVSPRRLPGRCRRRDALRHESLEQRRLLDAGSLDPAFGIGGTVTQSLTDQQDSIRAMAVQADGKIVCGGFNDFFFAHDFMLARYLPDGTLDPTFGPGGRGWVDNDLGADDAILGVAIQPDGKIVAAGTSGNGPAADFVVARYDAQGNLDATFGTGGLVFTDFGGGMSQDQASSVLLQPDGKIVVAGYTVLGGTGPLQFAMARYDTSGTLDPTFGTGGLVVTPVQVTDAAINSIALQADGRIVAAGTSRSGDQNFALARYTPAGVLDTTFDPVENDGVVTIDLGGDEVGRGVALLADGRILVAGYKNDAGGNTGILMRLNGDGSLEGTFGTGGIASTTIGGESYAVNGLAVQQNGRIVMAGEAGDYGSTRFAASRHNPDGTLDTTFGAGGTVTTDLPSPTETAYAVVL